MTHEEIYEYVVTPSDAACNATESATTLWVQVAARVFPALGTVSKAKRERKAGRLALNGDCTAPTNQAVASGDRLTYRPVDTPTHHGNHASEAAQRQWLAVCQRQGLRIVYDGATFAVIVKPGGIHVKGRGDRNVEFALPALLQRPASTVHPDVLPRPHAIHRLDYRVGGLLLVAKTRRAEVRLSAQLEQHRVQKRYRAIVVGQLDTMQLTSPRPDLPYSLPIGEDLYFITTPVDGKEACTAVSIRSISKSARYGHLTTVDLWPITGRWHQLRVHLASIGHPIVGDDLHHDVAELPDVVRGLGLFLYAISVRFEDESGNVRAFSVDEPNKFARFRHFCELNWEKQHVRDKKAVDMERIA